MRQAVLAWLAAHPRSTAEAIDAGVREEFGAPSFPAVGDDRHHLICRRCHRIDSVACVAGEQPCAPVKGACHVHHLASAVTGPALVAGLFHSTC